MCLTDFITILLVVMNYKNKNYSISLPQLGFWKSIVFTMFFLDSENYQKYLFSSILFKIGQFKQKISSLNWVNFIQNTIFPFVILLRPLQFWVTTDDLSKGSVLEGHTQKQEMLIQPENIDFSYLYTEKIYILLDCKRRHETPIQINIFANNMLFYLI